MISIILNGEEKMLGSGTIEAALTLEKIAPDLRRSVAVAVNGKVVPRENWDSVTLQKGDAVEIVMPFVGG